MSKILLVGITIFTIFKVQKQLKIPAGKCKINVTPYAISLFSVPNGLKELPEEFPFIPIGKYPGTQVGDQNNDFGAVSQTDLTTV